MIRGAVGNRKRAIQARDFTGLRYGKITPTDIDAVMDFGNRVFIFVEAKYRNAKLPYGQRLAIERIVDACSFDPDKIAIAIITEHETSPDTDIDFATSICREVRWRGKWKNVRHRNQSLKSAIDDVLRFSGMVGVL